MLLSGYQRSLSYGINKVFLTSFATFSRFVSISFTEIKHQTWIAHKVVLHVRQIVLNKIIYL